MLARLSEVLFQSGNGATEGRGVDGLQRQDDEVHDQHKLSGMNEDRTPVHQGSAWVEAAENYDDVEGKVADYPFSDEEDDEDAHMTRKGNGEEDQDEGAQHDDDDEIGVEEEEETTRKVYSSDDDEDEDAEDICGEPALASALLRPSALSPSADLDLEEAEKQVEEMWAGKSKVLVAVRVRPMNTKEKSSTRNVVRVVDDKMVVVLDRKDSAGQNKKRQRDDVLSKSRSREKRYAFDFAFGPASSTSEVYERTTRLLIDGVVIGYNATVFAYGATGAGKSHTMLGDAATDSTTNSNGIMYLTLEDLYKKINSNMRAAALQTGSAGVFSACEEKSEESEEKASEKDTPAVFGRSYRVTCSFLEVYNEMIRDLLTPSSEYLDLREDPVKGPTVTGLSEVEATCASDILALLRKGNARRTTEGTAANQASSRSHAVLQITVERRDNGINANSVAVSNVTLGKLSLIDLAGSERASVTQNTGMRLLEGANINRSLLALGNCINALREGGKGAFVPYRDSKLTRLLKDSLGGNCRTVMIAAISPAKNQIEETLNTLKYANRAKNIKTQAERNVLNVDYHVTEYVNLIGRLKTEIASLRNQLKKPSAQEAQFHLQALKANPKDQGSRKAVEKQQMALLREQLVLNFKERMQLCRSLIEIEAQNVANNSELELHCVVLQRWEETLDKRKEASTADEGHFNGEESAQEGDFAQDEQRETEYVTEKTKLKVATEPSNVREARIESQQLQRANMKNSQLKADIERRLEENEKASAALRTKMETRITTEERRELMELEYRIGMLELENMELERTRMLHRCSMQYKDMLIKRLLDQLQVRDDIIEEQRKLLFDNGVGDKTVKVALEDHFSDLESLHMLQSLPTGAPATPSTPTPRNGLPMHILHDNQSRKRTGSIYGLPSPVTGQMYPLHRLEEELRRIEGSKLTAPSQALDSSRSRSSSGKSSVNDDSSSRVSLNASRRNLRPKVPIASTSSSIDKRRQQRRHYNSSSNYLAYSGPHHAKKTHPYLRHSALARKSERSIRSKAKAKSQIQIEDVKKKPRTGKDAGKLIGAGSRTKVKKTNNNNDDEVEDEEQTPSQPPSREYANSLRRHRHVGHPVEQKYDAEEKAERPPSSPAGATATNGPSLPPIKLAHSQSTGSASLGRPLSAGATTGGRSGDEYFEPAPPVQPLGSPEGKSMDRANNNPKNVLSRLNSKIASGISLVDNQGVTSCESVEVAGTESKLDDVVDEQQRKQEKREKRKLEKNWAELNFVLRRPAESDMDLTGIYATAQRSLQFLDQLDRKAMELKVLRGTLSRMLLPYSEDTAAADQRANTPVTGDSPLDSVMDLETRRKMVGNANDLRSLVRVKIADDADLDQAKTAVTEISSFIEKLRTFAERKGQTPFQALSTFKAR